MATAKNGAGSSGASTPRPDAVPSSDGISAPTPTATRAPRKTAAAKATSTTAAKATGAGSRRVSVPQPVGATTKSPIDKPIRDEPAAFSPVIGRIPILDLSPQQPDDLWPAKAFVGEVVPFAATVFREGHDLLGADLVITSPGGEVSTHRLELKSKGTDRWGIELLLDEQGPHVWRISAWSDDWSTWLHNAGVKVPAGIDVEVMFQLGAELLRRGAADGRPSDEAGTLTQAAETLLDQSLAADVRLAVVDDPAVVAAVTARPITSLETLSPERVLRVERERAGRGSWYEFFPRSEGAKQRPDGSWQSGTFRTAARRLPHIAAMGFDVVYIPPIHPIGLTNRKGPNNTLVAGPNDPGSPYGIGSADGGHDALHPDLGDEADFAFFLETVAAAGLELAIDIALQASPDHPWVTEHPEFFTTLPDGSIAYAENPPKKYQDIYPLNFDNDPEGVYREMLRIFRRWTGLGVRIFRVDNPHTKPLAFWERLIAEIMAETPDAIFLSEAFTRPAMMRGLAKVGFQQSYTYYTWRNTKVELEEYLTELSHETADYLRPNFFVNTHDILTPYLQFGGRPGYKIRAAVAAASVPTWGVYSGYELFEDVARPGSEENIDNEKYEYKPRDWVKAQQLGLSLAPYLTKLNEIRRAHPALGQLRNTSIHWADDEQILVFTKHLDGRFTPDGQDDTIIVVANLDPHGVRETTVHLDPTVFGIEAGVAFDVHDLITDAVWTWSTDNYVRLDPYAEPVHILHVVRHASN